MPITASEGSAAFAAARPDLDDLIKRRFFYRQAFEIYGGVAGFYTYGPPGAAVKQNLIDLWRKHFVIEENLLEVDDCNIMPYDVLATSGHVERFNDFIVKDALDPNKFYRADKLLEDVMDARMAAKEATPELKKEYQTVKAQADAYSREELWEVFKKYLIKSPETGNELTEPQAFNLMFPVPIGPSGDQSGFLRPETAQGIFLNFKFCLEQNAGNMPFGVAQVGKAFRNEIAPRGGLIRTREFTQAEIEWFVKPGAKAHAKFESIAGLEMRLHPHKEQLAAEPDVKMTLGAAVSGGTIANETLAYFIARVYQFLLRAGCKAEHVRFRQHLPDEMAHYAADCWDAEIEMSQGWVECVGIADRSAYDLTCHAAATKTKLTAEAPLDEPITVVTYEVTKKSVAAIGKAFKKDAKAVQEALQALSTEELKALEAKAQAEGEAEIKTSCGTKFDISKELLVCEEKKVVQHVETFTPNVIEPSFGIDRILSAIYEHTFFVREGAADEGADAGGKKSKDKKEAKAGVLSLPAEVAPYKAVILPLDGRVAADPVYAEQCRSFRESLTEAGLQYKIDESGASIGRRYARADELGIPYAMTFDFDTIGKGEGGAFPKDSVTLRERDSSEQVRLPLAEAAGVLAKLCGASTMCWADLVAMYGDGASDAGGVGGMIAYLRKHDMTAKLNAAVNEVAKDQPADPMAALIALLQKA